MIIYFAHDINMLSYLFIKDFCILRLINKYNFILLNILIY